MCVCEDRVADGGREASQVAGRAVHALRTWALPGEAEPVWEHSGRGRTRSEPVSAGPSAVAPHTP